MVIASVQTALASISGVMSSTVNIQINQLTQQYLDSVGYQKMLKSFQHASDELTPINTKKQNDEQKATRDS